MGHKYQIWQKRSDTRPHSLDNLEQILLANREFSVLEHLNYGDHGLQAALENASLKRSTDGKKIALYADYDVDGTMSCVSWIWFFRAIGFTNYVHYIPCRFREGYGVNLDAVKHLIDDEDAAMIITMDTGITANQEAAYCRSRGVEFVCTDHHKIQADKMPDCIILNPKFHPEETYQELCGCGITFVLLRKLAQTFPVTNDLWVDLLALAGMATICDVVPLNQVNHRLAKLGVGALARSRRPVLQKLRQAGSLALGVDEKDVGFRLGPRINAVGRLEHADLVIKAFVEEEPGELIQFMEEVNDRRRSIQNKIIQQANQAAQAYMDDPVLFLGGDWHHGVVGIAASRLAEDYWRPTWLFHRGEDLCKGSARSIPGFDVTDAMGAVGDLFLKFGGHKAAGGYSFTPSNEDKIRQGLCDFAEAKRVEDPELWQSKMSFDCELPPELWDLGLIDRLEQLKPFGHGFEEPRFAIESDVVSLRFLNDKQTGEPRHTFATVRGEDGQTQIVKFFNQVFRPLQGARKARFLVTTEKNEFRGTTSLSMIGHDFEVLD